MYRLMKGYNVVAKSENLLKLLKIKFMTEHCHGIALALKIRDEQENTYDVIDLSPSEYISFIRFRNRVCGGKYFKAYDYRLRIRDCSIWDS